MSSSGHEGSPPKFQHYLPHLRGFLPLNDDSPLSTPGNQALNSLLRARSLGSNTSLHKLGSRRPSSVHRGYGDDHDEEASPGLERRFSRQPREGDDPTYERRANELLNGPQMRSMRLIGNSNPRYNWKKYWKTEEELKQMRKPM
jgi:hypothetical protein